jgi:hypothetical protein
LEPEKAIILEDDADLDIEFAKIANNDFDIDIEYDLLKLEGCNLVKEQLFQLAEMRMLYLLYHQPGFCRVYYNQQGGQTCVAKAVSDSSFN